MGRAKKKGPAKKAPKDNERPEKREWNDTPQNLENQAFKDYYKEQGIVQESEWDKFMTSLKEGLPISIRINGNIALAKFLQKQMFSLRDAEDNMTTSHELKWYHDQMAWQWNQINRKMVKKNPAFKELKQWFVRREIFGAISRQEAVSMIPPLFLDVQSDHMVLDLCAAPGSKTCQMIEKLHRRDLSDDARGLKLCKGAVLGNDIEWKRANMLAHQIQRLGSPAAAVVNVDATYFPKLYDPSALSASEKEAEKSPPSLLFDRILCDVPCSGDGTVRKTPHIWQTWTPQGSLGLHCRQYDILRRGLELLKVGGKLVYSTCSFNPMENEAVISSILRRFKNIELIEPEQGEGMKSAPAIPTWKVPAHGNDGMVFYEKYEDVPSFCRKEVSDPKIDTQLSSSLYSNFVEYHTRKENDKTNFIEDDEIINDLFTKLGILVDDKEERTILRKTTVEEKMIEFVVFMDKIITKHIGDGKRDQIEPPMNKKLQEVINKVPKIFRKIAATMFPPKPDDRRADAHLKAKRFFPHYMNTGGFFVAVFTKTDQEVLQQFDRNDTADSEFPGSDNEINSPRGEEKNEEPKQEMTPEEAEEARKNAIQASSGWKKQSDKNYNLITPGDIYSRLDFERPEWKKIQDFYGLPDWACSYLFWHQDVADRSDRKIYCLGEGLQKLVQAQARMKMRLVNVGIRVLQAMDSKLNLRCNWRLSQEGLEAMLALGLSKRILNPISIDFIRELLVRREIPTKEAKEKCLKWDPVLKEDGNLQAGSAVIMVEEGIFKNLAIHVIISNTTMTLYVDKQEAVALAESLSQPEDLRAYLVEKEAEAQVEPVEEGEIERPAGA